MDEGVEDESGLRSVGAEEKKIGVLQRDARYP